MKGVFKSIVVRILTAEAAMLLRRHKPTVVAVTGSVGKTSTKDAIYAAIKNDVYARKSQKSFNSEIGVPLTVLGLPNAWSNPFLWLRNIIDGFYTAAFTRKYPDVLVLETGIDRPGDMEKLTQWLKPDIVVLTRLPAVPVHVEYFASPDAIVAEKMRLVSALREGGKLIYNNDDTTIQANLTDVRQQRIGFGRYLETNFTARGDRVVYKDDVPVGVEFSVEYESQKHKVFVPDTVGTQHVYSCSAAVAVAVELGVSIERAVTALQSIEAPKGRMRIISGIKGTTLIDDTYNSSPIATEHALQALGELKHAKRKIAVLGDMLELGKYSTSEHKRIGEMVPEVADILFTVGVRARQIAEGALAAGLSDKTVFQYDDVMRAGRELQNFLEPGDVVLVKASQGIRAERIVEEVMAEPERASKLLVRQEDMWRNIA
ncbi:MAG: UDP-N-acetylmuramoyl-tripeptide--D-alanyl-D-alanine ligase [Candidatus Kaiserbacteria bacterium]|nr:UDP-N-acetylmuramoyl-tripeptide--D-alanyl-D-alanine ligase [Candidatus Kaiserbacteria bacterium]MCB9816119.1 UDP-N-acetylmuramoyl-tripeptide--D-alanyl-D-alanine ligase [Candidatus Nomurabacteria bacterium]